MTAGSLIYSAVGGFGSSCRDRSLTSLGRTGYFGMCMTLYSVSVVQRLNLDKNWPHLVSVSKPRDTTPFPTYEHNPLPTDPTPTFPSFTVSTSSVRYPHIHRLLEFCTRRSADAVPETLVVPESAVLENKPTAGTTEAAPAFAEWPLVAGVDRSVEIAREARVLTAKLGSRDIRGLCGWRKGWE